MPGYSKVGIAARDPSRVAVGGQINCYSRRSINDGRADHESIAKNTVFKSGLKRTFRIAYLANNSALSGSYTATDIGRGINLVGLVRDSRRSEQEMSAGSAHHFPNRSFANSKLPVKWSTNALDNHTLSCTVSIDVLHAYFPGISLSDPDFVASGTMY